MYAKADAVSVVVNTWLRERTTFSTFPVLLSFNFSITVSLCQRTLHLYKKYL